MYIDPEEIGRVQCKCIVAEGESIYVGDSMGGIAEILEKEMVFSTNSYIRTPSSSSSAAGSVGISCIHASEGMLVAGNEIGEVFCYSTHSFHELLCQFKPGGFITTSISCKTGVILAAYSCGHVRIFRVAIGFGELAVEMAAHSRCVNAIALHHENNIFATCSDDSMIHVWELPSVDAGSRPDVRLIFTENIANRLLTGLSFLRDGRLGVVAYDDENFHLFEPTH